MNGHKTGVAKAKGAANLLMALQPYACGYLDRFMGGIGRHFLPPQGRLPTNPSLVYGVLVPMVRP